jgi:hypothetical protein
MTKPPGTEQAISGPLRAAAEKAAEGRGGKDEVAMGDVMEPIFGHGLTLVIVILALLNIVLSPLPGASVVLGLPLVLATFHVAIGKGRPSLPRWVARWTYDGDKTVRGLRKGVGWAEWAEKFVRPRLQGLASDPMIRIAAWCSLAMALVLLAPLPFVNVTPALAIILLALGSMGRDGLVILAGLIVAGLHIVAVPAAWWWFSG